MDNIRTFCNDILKIDPKIRFAGIWYNGELVHKSREGLMTFLNEEETEKSVRGAVIRWVTRRHLGRTLGAPEFALAKYGKVYRITLSLTDNDLILVSTDIDCDIISLAHKIQKMKEDFLPILKNSE